MAVIFFREFAAAEAAVGNSSGAASLLQVTHDTPTRFPHLFIMMQLADLIATAMNKYLWSNDHYVTQMNLDGSTRDFIDYDSNLIATAAGVPSKSQAALLLRRIDGGRCSHGRATFVSEKYYGPHDTTNGNIGDSWCGIHHFPHRITVTLCTGVRWRATVGKRSCTSQHFHRIALFSFAGWFDALARQQVNDASTFSSLLLQPLADDVRRWTWLHERYFCDGTQQPNRTWAYAAVILFHY